MAPRRSLDKPPRRLRTIDLADENSSLDIPAIVLGRCSSCLIASIDPRIVYTGRWLYNLTGSHSSTSVGATITLPFTGHWVMAFGSIPASPTIDVVGPNSTKRPVNARYTVDDFEPVESAVPMAERYIPMQPFFSANGLGTEEHTLTIEVLDADATTPYIFQNFLILPHSFPTEILGDLDDDINPGGDRATVVPSAPDPVPTGPWEKDESTTARTIGLASQKALAISLAVVGSLLCILVIGLTLVCCVRRKRISNRIASYSISKFWGYAPQVSPAQLETQPAAVKDESVPVTKEPESKQPEPTS